MAFFDAQIAISLYMKCKRLDPVLFWSRTVDEIDHTLKHGTLKKRQKYAMIGMQFEIKFGNIPGRVQGNLADRAIYGSSHMTSTWANVYRIDLSECQGLPWDCSLRRTSGSFEWYYIRQKIVIAPGKFLYEAINTYSIHKIPFPWNRGAVIIILLFFKTTIYNELWAIL